MYCIASRDCSDETQGQPLSQFLCFLGNNTDCRGEPCALIYWVRTQGELFHSVPQKSLPYWFLEIKGDRGWPGPTWKPRTDGFTAGVEKELKGTSGLRCAGTAMFLSFYPLLTKDLSFFLFPFQEQRVNPWSSVPQDSVYARSLYVFVWKIQWHGLGHRNILSHRLQGGHVGGATQSIYTCLIFFLQAITTDNYQGDEKRNYFDFWSDPVCTLLCFSTRIFLVTSAFF